MAHYETYGSLILKVYAEAGMIEGLADAVAQGRAHHLSWCRRTFEVHLDAGGDAATRARRLAQVTAACDATTWRILHGRRPGPRQTRLALVVLVTRCWPDRRRPGPADPVSPALRSDTMAA